MNINHVSTNPNKDSIYNHPFFPLLTMMFEKCELATNSSGQLIGSVNDDIIEFLKSFDKEQFQFYLTDAEIDSLMIETIQILRFHILEIEKVHELCDSFCQKYINVLKGKMPVDFTMDDCKSEDESLMNTDDMKPTSLSSIDTESTALHRSSTDEISENTESDTYEENDQMPKRRPRKRGIFPKSATALMRAWLFQHLDHPYPSEEQKKIFARETNLNILQVNNWFINARRRIVQPMIDQSNRSAMMGTVYNDFMYTANRLPSIDSYQYEIPTHLCDELTKASSYQSPSIATCSSMYANPFFATINKSSSTFLPMHYEMPQSCYAVQQSSDESTFL